MFFMSITIDAKGDLFCIYRLRETHGGAACQLNGSGLTTYSYLAGDAILKQTGKILRENLYPLDVAARYGGEEFAILMPKTTLDKAVKAAERLRGIIDRWQWKVSDNPISVTISIGLVALDPNHILDCRDMVAKADAALYAAKHKGRNCVVNKRLTPF